MIENWSCIVGILLAILAPEGSDSHGVLRVQVEQVEPVAGFANLLADRAGDTLEIRITSEQLARSRSQVGKRIRLRIRRGGPVQIFAHPDWVPGEDDTCQTSGAPR